MTLRPMKGKTYWTSGVGGKFESDKVDARIRAGSLFLPSYLFIYYYLLWGQRGPKKIEGVKSPNKPGWERGTKCLLYFKGGGGLKIEVA